ncbi:sialidase family protein [Paenibacillus eucommiae]|uniref:Sialidase domain-containing protein n=1 Tax=Paenibacillus eucommiae TaxID=1355755 RepID=A0ABS4J903_9BACL|nr:sialidase family protein [Paenibacillus eucommiae]MBP1996285.1 hypothetical protein [Paenibacillus eucommiae]
MTTSSINSKVAQLLYEDSGHNLSHVIRLNDGSLFTLVCITKKNLSELDQAVCSHYVMGRQSLDNGRMWSDPRMLIAFPQQAGYISGQHFLQSRAGFLHVFSFRIKELNVKTNSFIGDTLHTRVDDIHGTNAITQKVECLDRYNGGMNSSLQLASGRIVIPISTVPQNTLGFVCSTIYSDDEGVTWKASNDVGISDGESHSESGAMEPVVIELNRAHILMLIRTTLGRFYYAISIDGGASWGPARPTLFRSSNAPTSLVRLGNGDIVKIWNHCLGYRYIEGISYARQVLHAAISEDGGTTWNGYREIIGRRQDDPPGVLNCYAFPIVLHDDELLVKYYSIESKEGATFNDPNAKLISFSSAFLKEKTIVEEFSNGLQAWSTVGKHVTTGTYRSDPSSPDKNMLQMSAGVDETAVASINFPYGSAGSLKIKMKSGKNLTGASLILSETYLDEYHFTGNDEEIKRIREIVLKDCVRLAVYGSSNQWEEWDISWDMNKNEVRLSDGTETQTIEVKSDIGGFSYLMFCLEGSEGEVQRLSIARVAAESQRGGYSGIEL